MSMSMWGGKGVRTKEKEEKKKKEKSQNNIEGNVNRSNVQVL